MFSHKIVSRLVSLPLLVNVRFSGVATNLLQAAGAVLFKPVLDSLLMSDSSDPTVTLSARIGDITYSKGLAVLNSAARGYQHDIVTPFVRITKPISSSMPPLEAPSTTAGVMFGIAACFLSLVAAGIFLVRTHAGSQPGDPSSPPPLRSLSETLAHNREQRQARNRRDMPRRRSGRRPPDPIPPNNNYNNVPTDDIKLPGPRRHPLVGAAGLSAPPPPPPPPPPPSFAIHADNPGRQAGANTLWKFLFGLLVMSLFIKYTPTSNDSCLDDIFVDLHDTPPKSPNSLGPMELQHSPAALPSPPGPLLVRFQAVHKAICGFVPTVFTSPCLFLRLTMDYLLCALLCWILSSICAQASGSACTEIDQVEEVIQVEVGPLSKQDIPQLVCEDILPQEDQLEDSGSHEQASILDTPNTVDIVVVPFVSEPDGGLPDPSPATSAEADSSTQPTEKRVPPPGRTRRTRPRRHPKFKPAASQPYLDEG